MFADWIKKKIRSVKEINAEKLESLLSSKKAGMDTSELTIYLMILVYTAIFSYFTLLKHYAFRSYAWDLGINNQALWTTLNSGKLFYYTPELFFNSSGSYFGLHFSPILFLLLPVYAIYQSPENLLVFQSFIVALGALPLYWFARDTLNSKLVAVGFSLAYLLYPPLQGANWFDFHVQAFLPLFFFSAMYYMKKEKWTKYFLFIVLALSIAENVSLVVLFFGLYGVLKYRSLLFKTLRQKKLADKKALVPLVTIALALVWILIARWIQNTFFPINPDYYSFYRAADWWSVLGIKGDPITMPLYILLNPLKALQALTYDAYLKLLFFILIFGALLFLPFKSSILLATLPVFGPAFLSNRQAFYVVGAHYPLYYIPFLFLAAVEGMKNGSHNVAVAKIRIRIKNMLILVAVFSLFASPLSPLLLTSDAMVPHFSEYTLPTIGEHEVALHRIMALVPSNASVLTQNNIFPHFSSRPNSYVYPLPQVFEYAPKETNEYVNQLISKSDYILVDMRYDAYTANLIQNKMQIFYKNFTLVRSEDGVFLYRNRATYP